MKRAGQLYDTICSMDNLRLAEQKARRGKRGQRGVAEFQQDTEGNLQQLHQVLVNQTYQIGEYTTFPVYEPKERLVYRLPYTDRIVQHAIMNPLEGIFVAMFTADTYSCIKGRGIHAASYKLRAAVRNTEANKYYLQFDIKKFYPSVNHEILKQLLRRKFKDERLLALLFHIIDSAPGLPIGNYLSQYFSNYFLTGFDHWIKQTMCVKHYYRYADDGVILGADKKYLHRLADAIQQYLRDELQLEVKPNYIIAPVTEGIDFLGYVLPDIHPAAPSHKTNMRPQAGQTTQPANDSIVHGLVETLQRATPNQKTFTTET